VFERDNRSSAGPRILFTSPWGPYPKRAVEEDPVDYFYYRNTLKQGLFQLRIFQSWHCLHFMAQNLPVDSTVLENPSPDQFKRELARHDYQVVALTFTQLLLGKVMEMARWLKNTHPDIQLVIGGYGTSLFTESFPLVDELRGLCDHICVGEGVAFFKEYLKDQWQLEVPQGPLTQDLLPAVNSLFRTRLPLFHQMVFVSGLGCIHGCSFCATSHHFKKQHIPLFVGDDIFSAIAAQAKKYPKIQSAIIYDEDFLAKRENVEALKAGMARHPELRSRPLLFTVFASMSSVRRYSIEDLLACGIGTVYIGVETLQEQILADEGLGKRKGDVEGLFRELHDHGINTLGSLIIGWDGQTPASADDDARRFVALNPTFYQVVPLHPAPGTPLWDRLKKEKRIRDDYRVEADGIGDFNFALKSMGREEAALLVSDTYTGLVDEGGPWPFRLAENLFRGFMNLGTSDNPLYRERAAAYGKMLETILPVALLSGFMFHGKPFQMRHRKFRQNVRHLSRGRYYRGVARGLAMLPGLLLLSWWGKLKYALNPLGDQPDKIRRTYHRSLSRGGG
jgi:radical SAM superfamily enzyme YgiQ (UPF0313 family)